MHKFNKKLHRSFFSALLFGTALLVLGAASLAAQEQSPPSGTNTGVPEIKNPPGIETAEDEYGHVHEHKNHTALFLGGAREKSLDGFVVGGEYERRLHRLVGIGLEAEYASGDLRDVAVAFPVSFHPGAGLRLAAGPGFEHGREETETPGEEGDKVTEFLFRFTLAYEFAVKERYTIAPSLTVDFVNGRQVWVYGVSFGVGF